MRFYGRRQEAGARNNQFTFSPLPLQETLDGMEAMRVRYELSRGQVFSQTDPHLEWFKFDRPTSCEITGLYQFELRTNLGQIAAAR